MRSLRRIRCWSALALLVLPGLLGLTHQPREAARAASGPQAAQPIYLPLVIQPASPPGGPPEGPPSGTLVDGGTFQAANGALVGVVEGTLAQSLPVTLTTVAAPAVALPAGTSAVGEYLLLSAQQLIQAPPDKPLLVGLPVPSGVDPQQLAVAALIPSSYATESSGAASGWATIPGSYDAANNLFVITMQLFTPDGVTLVLFADPNNHPQTAQAPVVQQGAPVRYVASCDPLRGSTACTSDNLQLLASELESVHQLFVDHFGFRAPLLHSYIGAFTGSDNKPMLQLTYNDVMVGTLPCTGANGKNILGQYSFTTQLLLVCMSTPTTGDAIRATVRHEFFHAIQAAYPNVSADYLASADQKDVGWVIEGMATMAEKSSFLPLRSSDFGLREVTEPLLSTDEDVEYEAQDLWIYTGAELDEDIGYLKAILEAGATPDHVKNALNLPDTYWSWVKNQVIEHHQSMNGAFSEPACTLELLALDPAEMEFLFFPDEFRKSGTLPPLTATVVEVNFNMSLHFARITADAGSDSDDLRYKVYEDGEAGCESVPDGGRVINEPALASLQPQDVPVGTVRYVVVANTSSSKSITYTVRISGD